MDQLPAFILTRKSYIYQPQKKAEGPVKPYYIMLSIMKANNVSVLAKYEHKKTEPKRELAVFRCEYFYRRKRGNRLKKRKNVFSDIFPK